MSYWEVLFSHSMLIGANLREGCSTDNYVTRSMSYYMSYWDRNTEQNKNCNGQSGFVPPTWAGETFDWSRAGVPALIVELCMKLTDSHG